MSLSTDQFFYEALRNSSDVTEIVGGRIANPALTYEQEDKWTAPYLIIELKSVSNQKGTKDDVGESDEDSATVDVFCLASTRDQLSSVTEIVRKTIRNAFKDEEGWDTMGFEITDYQFSAGEILLDPDKPAVYQTLRYVCDVQNLDTIWE